MATVVAAGLLLTAINGFARTITVVSYNVQNLFDATDDGGEYRQFTRAGGWTSVLYTAKLRAIGRALRAAERGGADLVALQEVEHYGAAQQLVNLELTGLGYRHVVWLPDPHNPTGPVVLSKLAVRRVGALWVSRSPGDGPRDGFKEDQDPPLRPILEVELALGAAGDAPSLFLFNNHWKSKQGGAAATEGYRRRSAALLAARLDEIVAADPTAEILVVGDLNEAVDEYARQGRRYVTALMPAPEASDAAGVLRVTGTIPPAAAPLELFSPWLGYQAGAAPPGSYHFRDAWVTIDHVLLGPGLFDEVGLSYAAGGFAVIHDGLLDAGGAPRGFHRGPPPSGFSDHLPLRLELTLHSGPSEALQAISGARWYPRGHPPTNSKRLAGTWSGKCRRGRPRPAARPAPPLGVYTPSPRAARATHAIPLTRAGRWWPTTRHRSPAAALVRTRCSLRSPSAPSGRATLRRSRGRRLLGGPGRADPDQIHRIKPVCRNTWPLRGPTSDSREQGGIQTPPEFAGFASCGAPAGQAAARLLRCAAALRVTCGRPAAPG